VTKEKLEELALEATRTIEIDEFVEKSEINRRYLRQICIREMSPCTDLICPRCGNGSVYGPNLPLVRKWVRVRT
jgi:hypothetical protein